MPRSKLFVVLTFDNDDDATKRNPLEEIIRRLDGFVLCRQRIVCLKHRLCDLIYLGVHEMVPKDAFLSRQQISDVVEGFPMRSVLERGPPDATGQ